MVSFNGFQVFSIEFKSREYGGQSRNSIPKSTWKLPNHLSDMTSLKRTDVVSGVCAAKDNGGHSAQNSISYSDEKRARGGDTTERFKCTQRKPLRHLVETSS